MDAAAVSTWRLPLPVWALFNGCLCHYIMTVSSRTVIQQTLLLSSCVCCFAHTIMVCCLLHTLIIELLRATPEVAAHVVQGLVSQLPSFHQKPVLLAAGTIPCMRDCCAGRILLHKLGTQQLVHRQILQDGRHTGCVCMSMCV